MTVPLRGRDMMEKGMTLGKPGKKVGVQGRFKQDK